MAMKKIDENGVYRDVDPKTGRFYDEGEYPLGSSLGQTEHQLTHTNMGRIVDIDEVTASVVDESGLAVIEEDEAKITQFIKQAVSIDNLVETFKDNSHETLLKLLALQDNKHPLKKGGIGIAYRTDALIMHCKMEFTAQENIVFDAILGTMSSFPENKTYRIEPASFLKLSKHENERYLYEIFQKGTKKLIERHLHFENLGPDGDDEIVVPWFDILQYHKKDKKNEVAYIEFMPTDFFKDLALCSQIVHGAYGSIEVTTQLRGKYTHAIFWFLENKKRYKAYPTARPGIFEISLEEFKNQFSIPETYVKSDIERRVLRPARDSINSIPECDFTFEYEAVMRSGKLVGYKFEIKEKNYIDSTATEVIEIEDKQQDPKFEQVSTILTASGFIFTEDEIDRICNCMTRNNKAVMDLITILPVFKSRIDNTSLEPVEDRVAYMCSLLQNNAAPKPQSNKNTNKFNNFSQRDYDMNELEKKLIGH